MSASNTKDLTLAKYLHANEQLRFTSVENDPLTMSAVKKSITEMGLKIYIILGILEKNVGRYYTLLKLLKNNELDQDTIDNLRSVLKDRTEKLKTAFDQYYSKRSKMVSLWPLEFVKGFEKENKRWKEKVKDLEKCCTEYYKELGKKWKKASTAATKSTPDRKSSQELDSVTDAIKAHFSLYTLREDLNRTVNTENFEAWKNAINEKKFTMEGILDIFEKKHGIICALLQKNSSLERSNRKEDRDNCSKISRALEEIATTGWADKMYAKFDEVNKDPFDSHLFGPLWCYFPIHKEIDHQFLNDTSEIIRQVKDYKVSINEKLKGWRK